MPSVGSLPNQSAGNAVKNMHCGLVVPLSSLRLDGLETVVDVFESSLRKHLLTTVNNVIPRVNDILDYLDTSLVITIRGFPFLI